MDRPSPRIVSVKGYKMILEKIDELIDDCDDKINQHIKNIEEYILGSDRSKHMNHSEFLESYERSIIKEKILKHKYQNIRVDLISLKNFSNPRSA